MGRAGTIAADIGTSLARAAAVPDDRIGWLAFAIPAADHIVRSQSIRHVITSSYPHSAHLVGLHLKKRFRLNWIADFRDGWSQNPYFAKYPTRVHRSLSLRMERQVAQRADAIITVSDPISDYFASLTDAGKVYTIPNGFDRADFRNAKPLEFDKFTLAYTGTLFMQRSPENFFAAVRGLLDSYPGLEDNFQVIFRSKFKPEHEQAIRDMNLQDIVQNWGMGKYRDALRLQASADALLVLEGEGQNSEIMLTQKIFEYLAAGKPVLAVAPQDTALARLVRRSGCGVVVPPDNIFRIKEMLFELFLGRLKVRRDESYISQFERSIQAGQFATIMRALPPPD
jgi:glycosyltransferase involved in cell wall biosynthesis